MFRQYLAQRYLQNPDQNLNSCCDISKICFVRPQRVILLLIIGCPAARNDHKIASVEQKNLSLWCLSTNILPRKYCSAGYFWRQLLRNFICLEGGGREGEGEFSQKRQTSEATAAVIMHSQLSHTFQSRFFSRNFVGDS